MNILQILIFEIQFMNRENTFPPSNIPEKLFFSKTYSFTHQDNN